MTRKFKVNSENIVYRILIVFLTFVFGVLINFNYSYAQNIPDSQSINLSYYEKWDWLGPNDPIYIDKLEDIFDKQNSSKYRVKFKDSAQEAYELRIYNPLGQEIGFVNIDNPKNNGEVYKDYKESVYGLEKSDGIKAGDLATFTICPKGNREEEKIIRQTIVKTSPKPSKSVIVNKGYKFNENDAKLFIGNTLEMPEGTTYSFLNNKPPKTSEIRNEIGKSTATVFVKHPDRQQQFLINTNFYVDDYYIPIVDNMDYDKIPESCHKLTFDPGNHGEIVEGKFTQMWIRPEQNLGIPYPEVRVDKGYELIGWDQIKEWESKKVTFKAKYKKLDAINEAKKDSYVKIKFLAGNGGSLEGKSEFLIPKGYSLSKMSENFIPPIAIRKDGWIFEKWNNNFDLKLNFYSDMVFTAKFKEGQAIQCAPEVQKDFSTNVNKEIEAKDLITNLNNLPKNLEVQWSEKPDFSKIGKTTGKINIVYPDGSRLENVDITLDIQAEDLGEKDDDQYIEEDDNSNEKEDEFKENLEEIQKEEFPELEENQDNSDEYVEEINPEDSKIEDFEDSSQSLSLSEKIKVIIKRLKMKLDGIEFIKKNMPYTYKRYENRLDEVIRRVEDAINVGEEYLNNSK